LSPHFRFGEISPYQVWHAVEPLVTPETRANASRFLSEVGWREFSYHQLFHNTDIHRRNLRAEFDQFPWEKPNAAHLSAWKKGTTGIELVDAGMRELWKVGTMHNRVRMVAASFLIKNLGIDWRIGEAWFWNTLVDADEASNPASWQWVAGSGYDAAPYFRVFNPELQAAKFDPDSVYRARWIEEYNTPLYPEPVVSLSETRARALADYSTMRGERPPQ
jgi:deoxyribodipyrimidine photo-lyase